MTGFRRVSFVPVLVLLTSSAAMAQGRPAPPTPFDRGFMTGSAGATFADQRAATFGLEIGERLNSRTQAYVAFNYFDNLFTDRAAADLNDLSETLTVLNGDSWAFTGRDRGLAFSGGARYLLARGPNVRPYVGGGPGVLNVKRTITEQFRGDVTDPFLNAFGAPDGAIDAARISTFRPMAEFIAGVGVGAGRTYVDAGYRFRKVFRAGDSFTFSQFTVGVGMRF
jgi:Outer membrane protein beta-barrel domain